MMISVDFDGVICERSGIPRPHFFDACPPVAEAKSALEYLATFHEVYILTARPKEEWPLIREWLEKWDFPIFEITNIKKLGTKVMIDDRAIRFTNWSDVCKYLG